MPSPPDEQDDLRQIVHDIRGSLSLIRFAVGAVVDGDADDPAFVEEMLRPVDAEVRRVNTVVSALPSLLVAGDPEELELGEVLRAAGALVMQDGLQVDISVQGTWMTGLRSDAVSAFASMFAIAAGDGAAAQVAFDAEVRELRVSGGTRWRGADSMLERLGDGFGAKVQVRPDGILLQWPS